VVLKPSHRVSRDLSIPTPAVGNTTPCAHHSFASSPFESTVFPPLHARPRTHIIYKFLLNTRTPTNRSSSSFGKGDLVCRSCSSICHNLHVYQFTIYNLQLVNTAPCPRPQGRGPRPSGHVLFNLRVGAPTRARMRRTRA